MICVYLITITTWINLITSHLKDYETLQSNNAYVKREFVNLKIEITK